MVGHHPLGRLAQPLEQREIPELIGLEHLEHLNRLIPDVLDEMAHIPRNNAHIARLVIKGPRRALGRKDGNARLAANEEIPLVGVGVPVHLAQRAGLDDGVGGRDGLGDGEVLGVGDAHLAARRHERVLRKHLVREVVLGLLDVLALGALVLDRARVGALENVLFARGDVLEDFGREMEVLGDDGLGGMSCAGELVDELATW